MNTMTIKRNIKNLVKLMLHTINKSKTKRFQPCLSYQCFYHDLFHGILPIYAPVVVKK